MGGGARHRPPPAGLSADDAARVDADEVDLTAALRATRDEAERELRELRDAARDAAWT